MARQRVQVGDLGQARLTPAAAPVDTFVRPQAGNTLSQLARGLSDLAPSVSRFAADVTQRAEQTQYQKGVEEARRLSESGKSYRDAIEKGDIKPIDSPWFKAGLKEQYGSVMADQWQGDLIIDAAQDPTLQTSTNLEDFDSFVKKHRDEWMAAHVGDNRDSFFENGFGHKADAYLMDQRRNMASVMGKRAEVLGDKYTIAEVSHSISFEAKRGTSTENIVAGLRGRFQDLVLQGRSVKSLHQVFAQAAINAAEAQNDPEMAKEILSKMPAGSGDATLYDLMQDDVEKSSDRISASNQSRHVWAREQAAEVRETNVREIQSGALGVLEGAKNPADPALIQPYIDRALSLGMPDVVESLRTAQAGYLRRDEADDPDWEKKLSAGVYRPQAGMGYTTIDKVLSARAEGHISASTRNRLINDLQEQERLNRERAIARTDPMLADGIRYVRGMFAAEFGETSQLKQVQANAAQAEFEAQYAQWRKGPGQGATMEQFQKWRTQTAWSIAPRLMGRDGVKEGIDQIPAPRLTPQLPDWKKEPAVGQDMPGLILRQVQQLREGKLSKFTPGVASVIHQFLGDNATPEDIEEFANTQLRITKSR